MVGKKRCKTHGGKVELAPLAYLIASPLMDKRSDYLPPELKARFEGLTGDAIDGLDETVKIQKAMETSLWSQMETGESNAAWKLLNELVQEYEYGNEQTRPQTFNRIKQTAKGGLKAYGVKREILDLHEKQRKQVETLTKCRKEIQETFTAEQHKEFLSIVLRILKARVDSSTLRAIAGDMDTAKLITVGDLKGASNGRILEKPLEAERVLRTEGDSDGSTGLRPTHTDE
jgi:hypothetical protein